MTVTDFLNQNPGYTRSYDDNTDTGYLKNLATGKQISFQSGKGSEYGLGGFDQNAQSNIITDVNKLIQSLSGPTQTQFKGQNQQSIQDIVNKLKGQQSFTGQNQQSVQDILNQLSGRIQSGFAYNPQEDAALRQAQEQAQKSTMEQMNTRGILNSTVTADRAAQATAQLVPQYEQLAYGRYQDQNQQLANLANQMQSVDDSAFNRSQAYNNQMLNLANQLQQMDDSTFNRYQQEQQAAFQQQQFQYQQQQDNLDRERQKIADAWNRVAQLGYADNDAAAILGVQPGTPSQQAREAAQAKADQIEMFNLELEAKRQDADTAFQRQLNIIDKEAAIRQQEKAQDFANERTLLRERAAVSSEQQYTPAQQASNYNTVYNNARKMLDAMSEMDTGNEYGPPNPVTGLSQSQERAYREIIRTVVEDPRLDDAQKAALLNQLGIPEL